MKLVFFLLIITGKTSMSQIAAKQKTDKPTVASYSSSLYGEIINKNNRHIANVSVMLLRKKDSSLVRGVISSDSGKFVFENISVGVYVVAASITGYKVAFSPVFSISSTQEHFDIGKLVLTEAEQELNTVTVITKRAPYEQKIDRLVINVASSATSVGNTALEILERSPGVSVDYQKKQLSMNGKNGVVLMINGKISRMPLDAVVQMLNGMSAGNIEKIELITTPPANLDAEGNAGYINIVLKANNNFGTNGSWAATLGYGAGWVEEASANINHRNGKLNLYGGLSYSRMVKPFPFSLYSEIRNGTEVTGITGYGNRTDTTRNINSRLGLDYQLSPNTIFGVLFTGYDNKYTQSETNYSTTSKNCIADSNYVYQNYETNHWYNYSVNINMQHNFNKNNVLYANVDYIHYYNNQPVHYLTSVSDGKENFLYDKTFRSGKITPIHFWVGVLDYSKKFNDKVSLDAGFKETISGFDNGISFDNYGANGWVNNSGLSAKYKLDESYTAGYASVNWNITKSTEAKVGIRYEYTNSNLGSIATMNIVDRHYGKFFPTVYLAQHLNDYNTISFAFNTRISRPTLNDLAPFTYYFDANLSLPATLLCSPLFQILSKQIIPTRNIYFHYRIARSTMPYPGFSHQQIHCPKK